MKRNTCTCTPTNHEYKHHLAPRQGSLGQPLTSDQEVKPPPFTPLTVMVTSKMRVREIMLLLLLLWMVVTSAGQGKWLQVM